MKQKIILGYEWDGSRYAWINQETGEEADREKFWEIEDEEKRQKHEEIMARLAKAQDLFAEMEFASERRAAHAFLKETFNL